MKVRNHLFLTIILIFLSLGIGSCVSVPLRHFEVETREFVYDTVIIEVQPTTFNRANAFQWIEFQVLLDKYGICAYSNIKLIERKPVFEPRLAWWRNDVSVFEANHRTLRDTNPNDRKLIAWIGFIPGHFVQKEYENVIGLNFGSNASIIIGEPSTSDLRVITMFHEFLHGIGLVNRDHRAEPTINPDRPNHCNNDLCVMFWELNDEQKLCLRCQGDLLKMRR